MVHHLKAGKKLLSAGAVVSIVLFAAALFPRIDWDRWYRFPLGVPDEALIPENYLSTISFLKKHLKPDEEFLTMTSEGSWYYFLDRPCPIRFQVVYQAMLSFHQREMVDDLRNSKVEWVLIENSHWANDMDGIDDKERLPIVYKFIAENFRFFKRIDDNEIWTRKETQKYQDGNLDRSSPASDSYAGTFRTWVPDWPRLVETEKA
jgi:hypothetical protein